MKKLIIVAITLLALTSCGNKYIEDGKNLVKNQKKLTNVELLSKIDTNNLYYAVIEDDKLYTVNVKTKLVEHVISDTTGVSATLLLFIVAFILTLFTLIIIKN